MTWFIAIALLVTCLGLLTRIGAHEAEQRYPPVGDFAQIEGLRIHYTDAGAGRAVVLVHGASTSLLDFQASIADHLSSGHRVITVDRPGHGYSDRPAGDWPDPAEQARLIRKLMRALGVERPLIVGHSWSGSVVLAYLLEYPEETAGGVLLAGGTHPWRGGVAWYNDLAGVPALGNLFAQTLVYPFGRLSLETAVGNVFAPNPVPEEYIEQTGVHLSLRPETFLANAEDVRMLSNYLAVQSRRYAEIRRPLLAVTGEKDNIVPAWNHAERLMRQIPQMQHVELTDTGHALHHTHPERITELIASFSRQLAAMDAQEAPSRKWGAKTQTSRTLSSSRSFQLRRAIESRRDSQ
jgi:pimeloyl-ACP methyl ester carboxylesterase